jgi:hypothetical protein
MRHLFCALYAALIVLFISGCTFLPLDGEEEQEPRRPSSSMYLCDEGRSFSASFDERGRKVSLMTEGRSRVLYRIKDSGETVRFAGQGYQLNVRNRPVPNLWVERGGIVFYKNCRQEEALY